MDLTGAALACAVVLWRAERAEAGQFFTRLQIARRLRGDAARRMYPHEITALELLAAFELVEKKEAGSEYEVIAYRWEYRVHADPMRTALKQTVSKMGAWSSKLWRQLAEVQRFSTYDEYNLRSTMNMPQEHFRTALERLRYRRILERYDDQKIGSGHLVKIHYPGGIEGR